MSLHRDQYAHDNIHRRHRSVIVSFIDQPSDLLYLALTSNQIHAIIYPDRHHSRLEGRIPASGYLGRPLRKPSPSTPSTLLQEAAMLLQMAVGSGRITSNKPVDIKSPVIFPYLRTKKAKIADIGEATLLQELMPPSTEAKAVGKPGRKKKVANGSAEDGEQKTET
ncbi:hypothetical protein M422DRAFT_271023 [Sphaerobolus stellatus SS14]|uniref:Uncharacterized protein n=1 Tax=Sphaerobolus stellatus (strain SS14) TaxID=990650 RepID=A0A0C9UFE6_SPHS4|nr:hypothetical protein M422DRAFT_271023 [Sphaerobolus stellatus SS14]